MKKWNSKKITDILNNELVKINGKAFEMEGKDIAVFDIDRGCRTDHGGPDGDGGMGVNEIARNAAPFFRKYKAKMEALISFLSKKGYEAKFAMDYGEKGHISFYISENKVPAMTKKLDAPVKAAPKKKESIIKKADKKLNQTDFIRMKINGLAHKEMIIKALAKNFEKSEAWAKSRFSTYEKAYGSMGQNDPKKKI